MKIILALVVAGLCWGPASWVGDQLNQPAAVIHEQMNDPATQQVLNDVWQR